MPNVGIDRIATKSVLFSHAPAQGGSYICWGGSHTYHQHPGDRKDQIKRSVFPYIGWTRNGIEPSTLGILDARFTDWVNSLMILQVWENKNVNELFDVRKLISPQKKRNWTVGFFSDLCWKSHGGLYKAQQRKKADRLTGGRDYLTEGLFGSRTKGLFTRNTSD